MPKSLSFDVKSLTLDEMALLLGAMLTHHTPQARKLLRKLRATLRGFDCPACEGAGYCDRCRGTLRLGG